MSKKILAMGASNSSKSINKELASFAARQVNEADIKVIDLNDFEMPIYGIDREKKDGIPQLAYDFKQLLADSDGIIISFAEHNGAYSVAFKNVMDWISRIKEPVWNNKPMLLMATSPGGRGGKTVLEIATNKFKFMNTNTIASFSLPSFRDNYSETGGITDQSLSDEFNRQLALFEAAL